MKRMIIALLLVFAVFFGCLGGGETPPENLTEETPPEPPAPTPSLTITNPVYGGEIETDNELADVAVAISTSNLLIKPAGGEAKKGEGHFHFILDGGDPIPVYSKTYVLYGVEAGEHVLEVVLMNNDHTQYSPTVRQSVAFTVVPGGYVPKSYDVSIGDFSYDPETITINLGDSVTWTNNGAYPRSATSTDNFDSEMLAPGESFTYTFTEEGAYEYFALSHMAMKGTVIVEGN